MKLLEARDTKMKILHSLLIEARDASKKYTEKLVKGQIDRVIVELEGSDSGSITKLANRYVRLEKAIEVMSEKRGELNAKLKDEVVDLFDPEDTVLTRVVETIGATMTLSKLVKAAEQKSKTTITKDYDAIIKELTELIPKELQAKVEEITAMYTKIVTVMPTDKSPALRVTSRTVVDESLNEDLTSFIKTLVTKAKKFMASMKSWGISYDKKLAAINKKLTTQKVTESKVTPKRISSKQEIDPKKYYSIFEKAPITGPYDSYSAAWRDCGGDVEEILVGSKLLTSKYASKLK